MVSKQGVRKTERLHPPRQLHLARDYLLHGANRPARRRRVAGARREDGVAPRNVELEEVAPGLEVALQRADEAEVLHALRVGGVLPLQEDDVALCAGCLVVHPPRQPRSLADRELLEALPSQVAAGRLPGDPGISKGPHLDVWAKRPDHALVVGSVVLDHVRKRIFGKTVRTRLPDARHAFRVVAPVESREPLQERVLPLGEVVVREQTSRAVHEPRRGTEIPAQHGVGHAPLPHALVLAVHEPGHWQDWYRGDFMRTAQLYLCGNAPSAAACRLRHAVERHRRPRLGNPVVGGLAPAALLRRERPVLEIALKDHPVRHGRGGLLYPALVERVRMAVYPADHLGVRPGRADAAHHRAHDAVVQLVQRNAAAARAQRPAGMALHAADAKA